MCTAFLCGSAVHAVSCLLNGGLEMKSWLWKKERKTPFYFYEFTALLSIEVILAFSSLGYFNLSFLPISITLVYIPVILGAFLLGPVEGMALGAVFGMTSIWKATFTATFYADQIFSPWLSGQPFASLFLSIGTRMMLGLIAGLLFRFAAQRREHCRLWIFGVGMLSTLVYSELVFLTMQMFFPEAGVKVWPLDAFLGLSVWLTMCCTGAILSVFFTLGQNSCMQRLGSKLMDGLQTREWVLKYLFCFVFVLLLLSGSLFFHFFEHVQIVLYKNQLVLSSEAYTGLLQVGIQFLLAMAAVAYLLSLMFVLFFSYSEEMRRRSEYDVLTGLYNRAAFRQKVFGNEGIGKTCGYFIILDIDEFKGINDSYGHPFGDWILQSAAYILKETFGSLAKIGRIGGDEFVVFLPGTTKQSEVEQYAREACYAFQLLDTGTDLMPSLSMGIVYAEKEPLRYEEFYRRADEALYQVKKQSKNGYAFWQQFA